MRERRSWRRALQALIQIGAAPITTNAMGTATLPLGGSGAILSHRAH